MTSSKNLSMTIEYDPDQNFLAGLQFWEPCDLGRLEKLLQTETILDRLQHARLKKLWDLRDVSREEIPVRYQTASNGTCKYGRLYPVGHLSFGEVSGDLRSYLLWDKWVPIDFVNAHPNIMLQVLAANGIPCPNLKEYCENRERILQELMAKFNVGRKAGKELFIRLLYLGSFQAWATSFGISRDKAQPEEFLTKFSEEMKRNAVVIAKANDGLRAAIKPNERSKATKKRSPGRPSKLQKLQDGTSQASNDQVVSFWCQEYERKAMQALFMFLEEKKILDRDHLQCMLRYDGIDILKDSWDAIKDKKAFLEDAEAFIFQKTGLKLTLASKPYSRSPLEDKIEQEANFWAQLPVEARNKLDMAIFKSLKTYPRMKAYFERFVSKILNNACFTWVQHKSQSNTFVAVQCKENDLTTSFKHVKSVIDVDGEDGEPHNGSFINTWLRDPDMRACDEVVFQPVNEDIDDPPEGNVFNLFQGFSVDKQVELERPIDDYLRVFHYIGLQFCENDPVKYQLLIDRLALLVQRPKVRMPFSFVFQNKPQGIGTDTWFNTVGRLLGERHYKASSNISDFLGKHAEGIENKLLVVLNELKFQDSSQHQARIKDLITCERTTVDAKYMRPFEVDVFAMIVFVSNNANAIHFDNEENERRFVVWHPTSSALRAIRNEMWAYLRDSLFPSPQFQLALYKYLVGVEVTGKDLLRSRELTMSEAYYLASEKNASIHAKFFASLLRGLCSKEALNDLARENSSYNSFKSASMSPAFEDATRYPWEPEGMHLYNSIRVEVIASQLHAMHRDFVSDVIGGTSKRGDFGKDLLKSVYNGIIKCVKNSEERYQFNPRQLWSFLVKKKWVVESVEKHKFDHAEELATQEVDSIFVELSQINPDTVQTRDLIPWW